jgi:hypothetical protein
MTAAQDALRAVPRRVRGAAGAGFAWIRERARHESRRRRLAWLAVALLLVAGPVGFDLARQSSFHASIELFPAPLPPYPAVHDPAYYRAFLGDPELRRQIQLNVGDGAEYRDVRIRPYPPRRTLIVTVTAGTPALARDFVNALGPQLAGASRRQIAVTTVRDAARIRAALQTARARRQPVARRRALARRLRAVERLVATQPARVLLGQAAAAPRLRRWADRVTDALPGSFPPRPGLGWVALAGLIVLAALWGAVLALVPPGREP